MKKIISSTALSILIFAGLNAGAQSVFLQQYTHLPLKKIVSLNNNILASDGNSFYINDKNGNNIISKSLNLTSAYLLQQMVTSQEGNVFCLYQYANGSASTAGMVVLSLDDRLNFRWMKSFSSSGSTFGYGMTSTADNGVMICGTSCSTGFFMMKLSSDGTQEFIKNVNISGYCIPYSITNYKTNQFAIATRMQNANDYEVIFIADNKGNVTTAKSMAFSNFIYIKSIKADEDGNIYTLVNESNGTSDIIKMTSDFLGYSKYHIGNGTQSIQLNDIAYSGTGLLAVGNINMDGSSNLGILTLAVDTKTNNVISKTSGKAGYNDAYSIIADNEERFYMSGTAVADGYVAKVNSDMTGFCNTNDISIDVVKQSELITDVSFTTSDGALFSQSNQQTSGTGGLIAISGFCDYQEIASGTSSISDGISVKSNLNIYPNPANNELNLIVNLNKLQEANSTIFDVLGRKIISTKLMNGANKIDISRLASGEYYISIYIDNQLVTKKFIKAQ